MRFSIDTIFHIIHTVCIVVVQRFMQAAVFPAEQS